MSFRSVVISNPVDLAVKNNNLIITNEDEFKIPIEDISNLIIEGVGVKLTSRLLSKLSQNNVSTIICDEKHLPSAIVLPLNTHHKSYKVFKTQLDQSQAFKKRIWQNIIKQKLYNQAEVLEIMGLTGYNLLKEFALKVESGDKGNKEAIGAKYYFRYLFGKEFKRGNEDWVNSALNYGYTILRSLIARTLVSYGYNTAIGIHHCNELNSFNLADDYIEPFRPIVDLWVYSNINMNKELTKEERISLIDIINYDCLIDGKKQSVLNAIDIMISSYTSSCNKKDHRNLKLPKIIPLEYHFYE